MKRNTPLPPQDATPHLGAYPSSGYKWEAVDPSSLGGTCELAAQPVLPCTAPEADRVEKDFTRTLATAMDLSLTLVADPNHFIVPADAPRGMMALASPSFAISTDPGAGECNLTLHEGYTTARHCASRTLESTQAITLMAQYLGRTKSSYPAVPAFLAKMLSQVGIRGLQPSRLVARCAALLAMLLRLGVDRSMEHQVPSEWISLAERGWKGAIAFPAILFEYVANDPLLCTRVWSLLLSRRVTVDGGGTPYLPTWPPLGEDGTDAILATHLQAITPPSALSWFERSDPECCVDVFFLSGGRFRLHVVLTAFVPVC